MKIALWVIEIVVGGSIFMIAGVQFLSLRWWALLVALVLYSVLLDLDV